MKGSHWTTQEDKQLRNMAGRFSAADIGKAIGRPKNGVHHRMRRLRLDGRMYGENHWNAKVADLMAAMIGSLYDAGYSTNDIHKAISEAQDISLATVCDIASCRTRKK